MGSIRPTTAHGPPHRCASTKAHTETTSHSAVVGAWPCSRRAVSAAAIAAVERLPSPLRFRSTADAETGARCEPPLRSRRRPRPRPPPARTIGWHSGKMPASASHAYDAAQAREARIRVALLEPSSSFSRLQRPPRAYAARARAVRHSRGPRPFSADVDHLNGESTAPRSSGAATSSSPFRVRDRLVHERVAETSAGLSSVVGGSVARRRERLLRLYASQGGCGQRASQSRMLAAALRGWRDRN